jgi:DNA polymerase-3 subunit delta'
MSFRDFSTEQASIAVLQRSLERGRLGHAYLFQGTDLAELATVARTLAKTLNCENPPSQGRSGLALDCCDACANCRKIDSDIHPDVLWIRPESKLRVIKIEQIRELLRTIYLKPTQAPFKVAVVVGADRLNVQAANAFLKTLEEPPADSVFILLSADPQRLLETILSRCLQLSFPAEANRFHDQAFTEWLGRFGELVAADERSLLARYRVLSLLLNKLTELKQSTEKALTERSPLERFDDVDPKLKEKWEDELTAAIEAEYRRQRADVLASVQWWLRDVWLQTLRLGSDLLAYPNFAHTARRIANRLTPEQAMENLQLLEQTQRLLASNVQEALALEVGLLKLKL